MAENKQNTTESVWPVPVEWVVDVWLGKNAESTNGWVFFFACFLKTCSVVWPAIQSFFPTVWYLLNRSISYHLPCYAFIPLQLQSCKIDFGQSSGTVWCHDDPFVVNHMHVWNSLRINCVVHRKSWCHDDPWDIYVHIDVTLWSFTPHPTQKQSEPKWCKKQEVGPFLKSCQDFHRSYGCFLKWWYPQNTPKRSFLVGKPMVVGYHHFRKHPYIPVKVLCFLQITQKKKRHDQDVESSEFGGFKASSMIYCSALPPPFTSNIIQQGQTSTLMWLKPWRFKEEALRSLIFIDYVLWCLAALFSGRSMIPPNSADVLWRIGVLYCIYCFATFSIEKIDPSKQ